MQSTSALVLNGGTLQDAGLNNISLTLPANCDPTSLCANNLFKINSILQISDGKAAFDIIGQYSTVAGFSPNYTQATANNAYGGVYALGISSGSSYGDAIDTVNHRLFVTDTGNNRVLVFNLDNNNNLVDKTPDFVLGQPNFTSNTAATTQAGMNVPRSLAYDSVNQRLFVSQHNSQRVTVYDVTTIVNGENAVNVLGQPNFTSSGSGATQAGMGAPYGLAYDATNQRLFVSQIGAHRVTVYDVNSITDGENAVNVLGQPDFISSTATTTQSGMNLPLGLAYDATNQRLFVSQQTANRVTVYNVASITDGQNAINVLGQANFTTATAAATQAGMSSPQGLAYDAINQRLFVAQSTSAQRVTIYNVATISNGQNAVNILGQTNFTNNTGATTQAGLNTPQGLAYDATNQRLYVTQSANRITIYDAKAIPTTNIISGNVYIDAGVTAIANGKVIKLLINGIAIATTTTSGGTGAYSFNAATLVSGDIVTVFIDNETEDGVTVTRSLAANITGLDIYQDKIIVRNEDGIALSLANLNTANDGDTDIITLYTDGATPVFQSGKELYIWAGKTFTPAATLNMDSNLKINIGSTLNAAANAITIKGNFINVGTFTHTASTSLTFNGTSAQSFNPGSSAIGSAITDSNTGGVISLLTNDLNMGANTFTIATNTIFSLAGKNITQTGTFANNGTLRLQGNETVNITTQDIDSGVWEYIGDGIGATSTYTIKDFGAIDYYNLIINDTSVSNSDTFNAASALTVAGTLNVTDGFMTNSTQNLAVTGATTFGFSGSFTSTTGTETFGGAVISAGQVNLGQGTSTINSSLSISNGTFTSTAGTLNILSDFFKTSGVFTHNSGTVVFASSTNHSVSGANTWNNLVFTETSNNANTSTVTFSAGDTQTITGDLTLDGLDNDDKLTILSSSVGTAATIDMTGSATLNAAHDFLSIKDSIILDNSSAFTVPVNPANSVSVSGNTGWFNLALNYSTSTFTESIANNGSIPTSVSFTLSGDTFALLGIQNSTQVIVTNVPAGLTAVVTTISSTTGTFTLSGNAISHLNANDIANVTVTWQNAAFSNNTSVNINNSTKNNFVVDFSDQPSIAYSVTTFTESLANNGSISNTSTITITGDTFTVPSGAMTSNTHYTVANVPAGLTAVVTGVSSTTATLTLTGNATSHLNANDIANLTLTFLDAAMTNVSANNTNGSSNTALIVDFLNQPSISYAGNFTESISNNGSLTGSRTSTLTGDTFHSGTLVEGVDYTLINKSVGLTAVMTRTSATVATLTFTGNAATHTNAVDVNNLTITWLSPAFVNTTVSSNVTNNTNAAGIIDFFDVTLNYDISTFTEGIANNGSIGNNPLTITLTGDTFSATAVSGLFVTTSNVPTGLTASFARIDSTHITLSLTGNATLHANANDIANLTVTFANAAFTNTLAANVTNSVKNNIAIDFGNPPIIVYSGSFTESTANSGALTDSIVATISPEDTFTHVGGTMTEGVDYTINNKPTGLTAVVTVNGAGTTVTLTLTGNATVHNNANDVANLTLTFLNPAFVLTPQLSVTGYQKTDGVINFIDVTLAYSSTVFIESPANSGNFITAIVVTLVGDTFQDIDGDNVLDVGTEISFANVPGGLTPAVSLSAGDTVATIILNGNAIAHANINDVSNLGVSFLNSAFSVTPASAVVNSTNVLTVDFSDQASIAYAGNFTENAANTGLLLGSRTSTITGDTFVNAGGTLIEGTHFSLLNKPAGVTAVMNVSSDGTVATLTFTGNATTHSNAVDVANLNITFLNGAFTNTTLANNVTNFNNAVGVIDFIDVALTFSANSFIESSSNDGSIGSGAININVAGDTFAANVVSGNLVTVTGLPAGLTGVFTRVSGAIVSLAIIGNATAHANINDIGGVTVTFLNGAFTNVVTASNVTNYIKNNMSIDFTDAATLSYSGLFSESLTNDGTVTSSIIATLTGDTFASTITAGTQVLITNVPSGLTAVATRNTATQVTITLTGNATAHTQANDISNLTISWQNGAFVSTPIATNVSGAIKSDGIINYRDVALNYSGSILNESVTNNGSLSNSIIATLTGDTFVSSGPLTLNTQYTVANVPTGLTPVVTINGSKTQATISFTGNATTHNNANDINNVTINFLGSAFTNVTNAVNITNSSKSNIVIDFIDVGLTYSTSVFTENSANNGSISNTIFATLTGDTFTTSGALTQNTHYTVNNLPTGLTLAISVNGAQNQAIITISGNAASHANINDIANLSINFLNAAFTNALASNVNNASKGNIIVDFNDQASIAWAGSFVEQIANIGSLSGSITARLTGDSYINAGGILTEGIHFTIANKPAGLTALMTVNAGGDLATLTLTGNAITHNNAADVANLTITFLNGTFTTTPVATNVNNSNYASGVIDFIDPSFVKSIAYSGTFGETTANNGSVNGFITANLVGDTYASTLTLGSNVLITNIPAGLAASISRLTNTTARIYLTGSALLHANANDVANLTIQFTDSAFTTGPAIAVTQYTKTNGIIDFNDTVTNNMSISQNRIGTEAGPLGVKFKIETTTNVTVNTTVSYSLSNLSATGGLDYDNTSNSATILAGTNSTIVTIPVFNDSLNEGTENFNITLGAVTLGDTNIAIIGGVAIGMIADDDAPSLDSDLDSINDTIETGSYNSGDANGDGTPDYMQPFIGGVPNLGTVSIPSDYVAVESMSNVCQVMETITTGTEAGLLVTDSSNDYPLGMVSYRLQCNAVAASTTVRLYFDTALTSTSGLTLRKGSGASATTVAGAVLDLVVIGGVNVIRATYSVIDGGTLDSDGLANGIIEDPIGLAQAVAVIVPPSGGGGGGGYFPVDYCPLMPGIQPYGTVCTGALQGTSTQLGIASSTVGKQTIIPTEEQCNAELKVSKPVSYYITKGNVPEDIKVVQRFLNSFEGANLPVDGIYSKAMLLEVNKWQEKYYDAVLKPWNLKKGTGFVFTQSIAQMKRQQVSVCTTPLPLIKARFTPTTSTTTIPLLPVTTSDKLSCNAVLAVSKPVRYTMQSKNNSADVIIVKKFLNTYENANLPMSGNYDVTMFNAVVKWQEKYYDAVLKPWNLKSGTGFVFTQSIAQMKRQQVTACRVPVSPIIQLVPLTIISTTTASNTPVCFTKNLKLEDEGKEVTQLQEFLVKNVFLTAKPNGYFGNATEDAVKLFQLAHKETFEKSGLSNPTGWFYDNTRSIANSLCK